MSTDARQSDQQISEATGPDERALRRQRLRRKTSPAVKEDIRHTEVAKQASESMKSSFFECGKPLSYRLKAFPCETRWWT